MPQVGGGCPPRRARSRPSDQRDPGALLEGLPGVAQHHVAAAVEVLGDLEGELGEEGLARSGAGLLDELVEARGDAVDAGVLGAVLRHIGGADPAGCPVHGALAVVDALEGEQGVLAALRGLLGERVGLEHLRGRVPVHRREGHLDLALEVAGAQGMVLPKGTAASGPTGVSSSTVADPSGVVTPPVSRAGSPGPALPEVTSSGSAPPGLAPPGASPAGSPASPPASGAPSPCRVRTPTKPPTPSTRPAITERQPTGT